MRKRTALGGREFGPAGSSRSDGVPQPYGSVLLPQSCPVGFYKSGDYCIRWSPYSLCSRPMWKRWHNQIWFVTTYKTYELGRIRKVRRSSSNIKHCSVPRHTSTENTISADYVVTNLLSSSFVLVLYLAGAGGSLPDVEALVFKDTPNFTVKIDEFIPSWHRPGTQVTVELFFKKKKKKVSSLTLLVPEEFE